MVGGRWWWCDDGVGWVGLWMGHGFGFGFGGMGWDTMNPVASGHENYE